MRRVAALVVAAGRGRRFGALKQFAPLGGKSVLAWSLEALESDRRVAEIILVLPEKKMGRPFTAAFKKITSVVKGGEKRQDSVAAGFRRIDARTAGLVLVHDGARPLISRELVRRIIEKTESRGAAVPVIPVDDTLKEAAGGKIIRTLERANLIRVQTPQGFTYDLLSKALARAKRDRFYGTDEAALVERLGGNVFTVPGDPKNIKITTPHDLKTAEAFLATRQKLLRRGPR
jgi:2-C-methyl-D-erythritol 4-phosphate cytidylyltransferase